MPTPVCTAIHVVGAALIERGRCLAARRGEAMDQGGLWEFPGGKVEAGERPEEALARELREELGVECEIGPWLGRGESRVGERRIQLDVYRARMRSGTPSPREHAELRWIGPDEIDALQWAAADIPILPALRAALVG